MTTREQAEHEAARCGLKDGTDSFETAVEMAMRGWPAWRIATHFQCSPKLIYDLGGNPPPPDK